MCMLQTYVSKQIVTFHSNGGNCLFQRQSAPVVKGKADFHSASCSLFFHQCQSRAAATERKGKKPAACLISFLWQQRHSRLER